MGTNTLKPAKGVIYIFEGCISVGKSTICKSIKNYVDRQSDETRECITIMEEIPQPLLTLYLKGMQHDFLPSKKFLLIFIAILVIFSLQLPFFEIDLSAFIILAVVFYALDQYYLKSKRNRYAFPFQIIMIRNRIESMCRAIQEAENGKIVLVDRGIPGDLSFAQMQYSKGYMTSEEIDVYKALVEDAFPHLIPQTMETENKNDNTNGNSTKNGKNNKNVEINLVYLECSPEVAMQRLYERGNESEISGYTLQYFEDLIKEYNYIIGKYEESSKTINIQRLDCNTSIAINAKTKLFSHDDIQLFLNNIGFFKK